MGGAVTTPHAIINPDSMAKPVGYAHAVVSTAGRTVYLGGQTAQGSDGRIHAATMAEQFDRALANVVTALEASHAKPAHLVSLQVLVTDAGEYRGVLAELGAVYKRHLGRHYPAITFVEVAGLFDPAAKVEITGIAVVPDNSDPNDL
jgi:enamine deaminase RidA (YjgF/YER057c/UK114 family)